MSDYFKNAVQVEDGKHYEIPHLFSIEKCTKEKYKIKFCADLSSDKGKVYLKLHVKTPFGKFSSEQYTFNSDKDFNLEFKSTKVSAKILIKEFEVHNAEITFKLTIKGCVTIMWIGEKCIDQTIDVKMPVSTSSIDSLFGRASSGDLALLMLGDKENNCSCNQ